MTVQPTPTVRAAVTLILVLAAAWAALTLAPAAPAGEPRPSEFTVDWRDDVAPAADFEPLLAKARADGSVRAIVGLQAYWSADALLTPAERTRQQDDLARLRKELLGTLTRGTYNIVRKYDRLPLVTLKLSEQALLALQRGARAAKLQEDAVQALHLAGTTRIVEAAETTALGFTGAGKRIAVLDTGVDADHPFFGGRVDTPSSACFSSNDCPNGIIGPGVAEPCTYTPNSQLCEHGTHVAGIGAGANGTDAGVTFSGVAPGATIIPVKVTSRVKFAPQCFQAGDNLCPVPYTADVIAGLNFVHKLADADVVNMSLGSGSFAGPCGGNQFAFLVAVMQLVADGTAVVASSGNSGSKSGIGSPACVQGVISVGRTSDNDVVHASSQSASFLSLLAPGTNVRSSVAGAFGNMSGTSMSAPHVAGAIAVLLGRVPGATPAQLLGAMQQTGQPITDPGNGVTTPRLRLLTALVSFGDTGFANSYAELLKGGKLFSEGASTRNMPASSETIKISGIQPADAIQAAHLYFMTAGAADTDARVLLNGVLVDAALIGASRTPCGVLGGGAVRVYRADVTGLVPGNGTYTINAIAPSGEGVSLVVVTENPGASFTKHVVIRAGAITALQGEAMAHSFTVFPPLKDVDVHVGMGDGDSTTEEAMKLGGLPLFVANAFSGTDGGNWDDRQTFLKGTPSLQVQNGQLENSIKTGTDCLAWAYSGLAYRIS
jgi:subtilisin family serine protease